MRLAAQIKRLFRNLLRRDQLESVLDEELNGYIDEMAARKVRAGMAPAEARRQARSEAGGLEQVKEEVREAWLGNAIETAIRDVRYACRAMASAAVALARPHRVRTSGRAWRRRRRRRARRSARSAGSERSAGACLDRRRGGR